jgi:hypothetical protein
MVGIAHITAMLSLFMSTYLLGLNATAYEYRLGLKKEIH